MIRSILLLGNPKLYEISETITYEEASGLEWLVTDLHDTLIDFRKRYGCGRAIAAPQIGVQKRLIYMYIDQPKAFINPVLKFSSTSECMEVLDDCMSFPGLLVKVMRHKECTISYKNLKWVDCEMRLNGSLSELLQHEYDHLNGILATMRANDKKSFYMSPQKT